LTIDTQGEPNFVHDLIRFATETCKVYTQKLKTTGTGVTMTEAVSSCSLISPAIYRQFIRPYHNE